MRARAVVHTCARHLPFPRTRRRGARHTDTPGAMRAAGHAWLIDPMQQHSKLVYLGRLG
jgi:hypothetical protein